MNIAICVTGASKRITQSLESISRVKVTGNVKVFIHTWMNLEGSSVIQNVVTCQRNTPYFTPQDVVNSFVFEKLQLDCLDTALDFIKNSTKNICLSLYPNALSPYCMLYSMQQVEKLKTEYELERNMKFDIVYRMRFDSLITNPEMLPTAPYESETLAIPHENDWGYINDQFAYGTSLSVSKYLRSFSVIPFLGENTYFNTEQLLWNCLNYQNLACTRTPLSVSIN